MVWHWVGSWQAEKASCFIGDVGEIGEAAAFANDVEQIAMFAGRRVRPFACRTLAGFPDRVAGRKGSAPGVLWTVANQPVAALPPAVGEVAAGTTPRHRARETVRQIGGLMAHG